ncbi:TfoX/Sxy family protein [bacterium]|nr:TfoX/Sxy family protein [bacterium]
MPYNESIAQRINEVLAATGPIDQKKMFGGVCYLHDGNMLCGVYKEFMILRLGAEKGMEALEKPGVRPFDITGRPMKGWVMVEEAAFTGREELENWIGLAHQFVVTLPSK